MSGVVSTGNRCTNGSEAIAGSVGVVSQTSTLISLAQGGETRYQYGERSIQYQYGEKEAKG